MNLAERQQRESLLFSTFSPSSPVSDTTLFAGRTDERREILSAIGQTGQHAILFGERGVGKTSLANILAKESIAKGPLLAIRVNCDSKDDFSSIWHKVAAEIRVISERPGIGFASQADVMATTMESTLRDDVRPVHVRKLLEEAGAVRVCIIVIDEFDRITPGSSALFADTIKMLSDHAVPATIIFVGVADSVDALMREHASVERALVQVLMPRMSAAEIEEIIGSGISRSLMTVTSDALKTMVRLSQGLPHYAHLLAQNAGLQALDAGRTEISDSDVGAALRRAVDKAQESIKTAYYNATVSPRKESIYAQVLLACALAKPDSRGYFPAADVRDPLTAIMRRRYEIPAFSRHLNDFCEKKHGPVLQRIGTTRKYRFRFVNPLMQPYIVMNGISSGLIDQTALLPDS